MYIFFNVFQHSRSACVLEGDEVESLPHEMILTWGKSFRLSSLSGEELLNQTGGRLPSLKLAQGALVHTACRIQI